MRRRVSAYLARKLSLFSGGAAADSILELSHCTWNAPRQLLTESIKYRVPEFQGDSVGVDRFSQHFWREALDHSPVERLGRPGMPRLRRQPCEPRRAGVERSKAPPASVQKLQMALHAKAKGSPNFRFYSLFRQPMSP